MEQENGSETVPATFEQAFETAEKAVASLERGELTLEESLAEYESGLGALRRCYGILQKAQKRVEVLSGGQDLNAAPGAEGAVVDGASPPGGASPESGGRAPAAWRAAASIPPLKDALDRIDGDASDESRSSRGGAAAGPDSPQVSFGDE